MPSQTRPICLYGSRDRRIVLNEHQAVEIYRLKKPEPVGERVNRRSESWSRLVAERYGVSPKTVRDIWNHKTWVLVTKGLYLENEKITDDLEIKARRDDETVCTL
jgi:hypothetical protein